jgi:hypothetical protein
MEKAISILLVSMLLMSVFVVLRIHTASALGEPTAEFKFLPTVVDVTTVPTDFEVALVLENAYNLSGIDFMIGWNTTLLTYLNHTQTAGTESYPAPNGPSPYAGCMPEPILGPFADTVDLGAGTYYGAWSEGLDGGGLQNGSSTLVTIWFRVTDLPWDYEIFPDLYIPTNLTYVSTDPARSVGAGGGTHPHTTTEGEVRLWGREVEYPEFPMLKITPEDISGIPACTNFEIDVNLLAADGGDLHPFWDVAGIDVYVNFNTTMLEVVNATLDPDGWFAGFYPGGITPLLGGVNGSGFEFNNTEGWVHVAFIGLPGVGPSWSAPFGQGRMFSVEFHALLDSEEYPPPCAPIYLENPQAYTGEFNLDCIDGVIDITNAGEIIGSTWHEITPSYCQGPFELISWEDNGDGELSASDQFILNDTSTGFYFDYHLEAAPTGTLNLTLYKFSQQGYMMDGPYGWFDSGNAFDGVGVANYTGLVPMQYLVDTIVNFTVIPQSGAAPYQLVDGVDFQVHGNGSLELMTGLDELVLNENMGNMSFQIDTGGIGWPGLGGYLAPYSVIASSFISVYVDFNNGTARYAMNSGYHSDKWEYAGWPAMPPGGEYWYDPDYPYEMESWWATGFLDAYLGIGPTVTTWPDLVGYGTETDIWINYTMPPEVYIEYLTQPSTVFVDFDGTYADFETVIAGNPSNNTWNEIYPRSWQSYFFSDWDDKDSSTDLTIGDWMITPDGTIFICDGIATDLFVKRKAWVSEHGPEDPFHGIAPIVNIASMPHPERLFSPWYGEEYSVGLPHTVENAEFCAFFKPPGAWIDVYTQYPPPYGGQGPHNPSDMFWPQKEVLLCANVTYNFWPEQQKDVAFEIKDPHMNVWGVWYGRTNEDGVACVSVRLPWPCDDPEYYFGVWHVYATVDVACIVVNDTLDFHYDYLVRIFEVTADKEAYKHCEYINLEICYGTHAMQYYNITFTMTATDETGVPFGFDYLMQTIGGAVFCQYAMGCLNLTVHIPKFARAGLAVIYIGALSDFPQNGGSAETPVYTIEVGILAE